MIDRCVQRKEEDAKSLSEAEKELETARKSDEAQAVLCLPFRSVLTIITAD